MQVLFELLYFRFKRITSKCTYEICISPIHKGNTLSIRDRSILNLKFKVDQLNKYLHIPGKGEYREGFGKVKV